MKALLLSLLFLGASVPLQATPQLYEKTYEEKAETGKPLSLTIRETERGDKTSTFVIEFRSGASVPSVMAIVRAAWDVAKIRGKRYFINLKEWKDKEGRWCYVIGYADREDPDPLAKFEIKESDKGPDELKYLDAEAFASILKN